MPDVFLAGARLTQTACQQALLEVLGKALVMVTDSEDKPMAEVAVEDYAAGTLPTLLVLTPLREIA